MSDEIILLKRRVSQLECDVARLNNIIAGTAMTINEQQHIEFTCGVCGVNPNEWGGDCALLTCPHGLNKTEDEKDV